MKFDVYGRLQLEVAWLNGAWTVYRLGVGTRAKASDLVIPPDVSADEIATYLDDLFHELSRPGENVRPLR